MWPINYILLFVAFIIISCELRSSIAFDEPENCKQLKFDFNDFLLDYVKCCQSMCQVKFGVDAVAGVPYFYKAGLSPRFKGADTKLDYMACDTADDRRSCGHSKSAVTKNVIFLSSSLINFYLQLVGIKQAL